MADARPLRAAPEPSDEPVVLTIDGENVVTWPHDPAYRLALYAQQIETDLGNAERSLRGLRSALTKARKDADAEATAKRINHPAREFIFKVFELWRVESGRLGCKLTPERFDLVADRLREQYAPKHLLMAALGIALNPHVIEGERKNDFDTAFKTGGQIERYANRCPRERRAQIAAEDNNIGVGEDAPL